MASGKINRNPITSSVVSISNSDSIADNSVKSFTIDVSRTGYTALGIVGVTGSGTSGLVLQEYYLSGGGNAMIYFRNVSGSAKTPTQIQVHVLYKELSTS